MNIKKLLCFILATLMVVLTAFVACSEVPEIEGEGMPENLLSLEDYLALDKTAKKAYVESFNGDNDNLIKWYQEAYRLSDRKGDMSSKTGYMEGFDKTGFPKTVLTWEEYNCLGGGFEEDGWRIQTPYLKTFATTSDFIRWSNEAQRIYEEEQDREEIGDSDVEIDMSK